MPDGFEKLAEIGRKMEILENEIAIAKAEVRLHELRGEEVTKEEKEKVRLAEKALEKLSIPYDNFPI